MYRLGVIEKQYTMLTEKQIYNFWSKIAKQSNGCWEWTGFYKKKRYPQGTYPCYKFRTGKRSIGIYAARLASLLANDQEVEDGRHSPKKVKNQGKFLWNDTCNNALCVNPEHKYAKVVKHDS